ncbi:MAG: 3-hydroxyacyl-CoA dehydrogenase NAD-binding domain-containing protein [Bacteroidota bacterium]
MQQPIKIGVAGAGAMGTGIAQVAATAGHPVVIYDPYETSLGRSKGILDGDFAKLVSKGKLDQSKATSIRNAISHTSNLDDLKGCGMVIEAAVEMMEVKKKLFADLESVVDDDCILATNTSSLSVIAIAAVCSHRSRVVGIHFFNPAAIMPLVEIIPAFTTAESVYQNSKALIDSWGKTTVKAKDTPGFIVNRIARPFYGEAIKIYEEGIASFADIDHAMRSIGGFRMGPFELMDMIGNDINFSVTETVWRQMFYDARYRPSITQQRLSEAGLFGRKSGRGYYDYAEGATKPEPTADDRKLQYIFNRILCMLINEAVDALYLGIASRDDIETAMTKGVNYPKGLLRWCDELGAAHVLDTISRMHADYLDDRYRPSLLLKKSAAEHSRFF